MEPSLSQIIESIIFVSEQPVTLEFVRESFKFKASEKEEENNQEEPHGEETEEEEEEGVSTYELLANLGEEDWENTIAELLKKYDSEAFPFEIRKLDGGYQFFTKRKYHTFVKKATLTKNQKRLTRTALETLSIIAYRQPITKAEMEFIRGVNCDYAVQKLLDKKLVTIVGRSDAAGRPLLYATSPFFMQYFGLGDISDLPKLKEFEELAEDHQELFKQHQVELKAKKDGKENESELEEGSLLEGDDEGEIFEEFQEEADNQE